VPGDRPRRRYSVRFRFSIPDDESKGPRLHRAFVVLLEAFGKLRRLDADPRMGVEDEKLPPEDGG
jgi:hypothetical protein